MTEINREAFRPAFETWYAANSTIHLELMNTLARDPRTGAYLFRIPNYAFNAWCAAMESLLTDEAIDRLAEKIMAPRSMLSDAEWDSAREQAREQAEAVILSAITGKTEGG